MHYYYFFLFSTAICVAFINLAYILEHPIRYYLSAVLSTWIAVILQWNLAWMLKPALKCLIKPRRFNLFRLLIAVSKRVLSGRSVIIRHFFSFHWGKVMFINCKFKINFVASSACLMNINTLSGIHKFFSHFIIQELQLCWEFIQNKRVFVGTIGGRVYSNDFPTLSVIFDVQFTSDISTIQEGSSTSTRMVVFIQYFQLKWCGAIAAFQGLSERRIFA